MLHLLAVDKLLHELQPPLNKESLKQNLVPWLNDIRMCQNTVNSILSLTSQSQWVDELKLSWQLIQAMRMFLEHVMLHHTKVSVKYARRLETVSVIGSSSSAFQFLKGGMYRVNKSHSIILFMFC